MIMDLNDSNGKVWVCQIHTMNIPCIMRVAVLLSVRPDPIAWQYISLLLLFSADVITVRLTLRTLSALSNSSVFCWVNPFEGFGSSIATEPSTKYNNALVLLAVQVNCIVLPSITVIDSGWTRNTIINDNYNPILHFPY